jgi:hypothetical protein
VIAPHDSAFGYRRWLLGVLLVTALAVALVGPGAARADKLPDALSICVVSVLCYALMRAFVWVAARTLTRSWRRLVRNWVFCSRGGPLFLSALYLGSWCPGALDPPAWPSGATRPDRRRVIAAIRGSQTVPPPRRVAAHGRRGSRHSVRALMSSARGLAALLLAVGLANQHSRDDTARRTPPRGRPHLAGSRGAPNSAETWNGGWVLEEDPRLNGSGRRRVVCGHPGQPGPCHPRRVKRLRPTAITW